MLLTIAFCLDTSDKIYKEFKQLKNDIVPDAITMAEMEGACRQIAHNLMDYVITTDKENEEVVTANLEFLTKTGTKHLEHECHIGQEEEKKAQELVAKINKFSSACAQIINLKKQGLSSNEILEKEEQVFRPAMDLLLEQLTEHKAKYMEELAKAEKAVQHAHFSRERITLLAIAVVVLSVTVIAITTTRSIVNPLHALHKGTEIIGKGNLNFKVATDKKDEIGQLSRAFDKMTGDLMKRTVSVNRLHAANTAHQ